MNAVDAIPGRAEGVVYIYSLHDPITEEVRYIGKAVNPRARLNQHVREVNRGRETYFKSWIKVLLGRGLKPTMRIVETCCPDTWEERERAVIADHRTKGVRLTNTAAGGNAPHCTVEDCRAGALAMNSSEDIRLFKMMRFLRAAARSKEAAGDIVRAARYDYAVDKMRDATGTKRDALRAFAESRSF
jgi:hypothetical protein